MSAQIIAFPRSYRKSREQARQENIEALVAMHIKWAKTPEQRKRARADALALVAKLEEVARRLHRQRRTEAGGEPPPQAS